MIDHYRILRVLLMIMIVMIIPTIILYLELSGFEDLRSFMLFWISDYIFIFFMIFFDYYYESIFDFFSTGIDFILFYQISI